MNSRRRDLRAPRAGQIEHRARTGKCAEENPDLSLALIKEILMGIEEFKRGECFEYEFG